MRSVRRDLGPIDVLLDQFSIAGWPGNADDTRRKEESRQGVMRKFLQDIETFEPVTSFLSQVSSASPTGRTPI
jgi:hypothetical protein